MVAIAITRRDLTAANLRAAAAKSRDAQAARRMLAIALVLEGVDRKTAAETCGMDRQTLRDWVHRHNCKRRSNRCRNGSGPESSPFRLVVTVEVRCRCPWHAMRACGVLPLGLPQF